MQRESRQWTQCSQYGGCRRKRGMEQSDRIEGRDKDKSFVVSDGQGQHQHTDFTSSSHNWHVNKKGKVLQDDSFSNEHRNKRVCGPKVRMEVIDRTWKGKHTSDSLSDQNYTNRRHGTQKWENLMEDKLAEKMRRTQLSISGNPPEQSRGTPVESSTRVNQVDANEKLARQLQEKFSCELQGSNSSDKVNGSTSLSSNDGRQPTSTTRRSPFNCSATSMDNLCAYYARLQQPTTREQTPASTRRDNYGAEMDRETKMVAEVKRSFNSAQMGRETKHNLVEALEVAFDNCNDVFSENVLQNRDDVHVDDYEMMFGFDEHNYQNKGASEAQINNLPESIVQRDQIEESCAICLETPTEGDVIRHLPCLHKFHTECIDKWLMKQSSCPVCKSGIADAS